VRTYDKLFIGGRWMAPAGTGVIDVISPHSEEPIGRVPEATEADVDAAVAAARQAFDHGEWPRMTPEERCTVVRRFMDLYASRLGEMAQVITDEMGSPLAWSELAQSPSAWMMLNSFLTIAESYPWEETRTGMLGQQVIVRREPVGVVGTIAPWNVPQFTVMSKLAPALIAGCTIVIKPAPETPLDCFLMAEMIAEADIPEGVVSIVPAGREVGEYLVQHAGVDKIAFTGSTAAGRKIGAICAEQLKRFSLELGGKSAAIILDDADLPAIMPELKSATLMNNGQACILQSRVLVSKRRYAEVVDAVGQMMSELNVGDPNDRATDVGPLVAKRQQERVEKYIALGQEEGARVVVGGNGRPTGQERGWYVQPTLFADVSNDMRIAQEEIFGPVIAMIPYADEEDAIRIANDSEYGLGGSVWSTDAEHALNVARRIRTGTIAVNRYLMDFFAPFGGFKASGIGREFGREGLEEYLEAKTMIPPF
jgi:betaine-aldehyde dehydrogenase